jgi:tetrahydromethanopterin S-methyltransferase subunit G
MENEGKVLNGGDKVPFLQNGNNTEINKKLDTVKKGIQTFFGDAEERFFQSAGREISEKILLESFILYRVDFSFPVNKIFQS